MFPPFYSTRNITEFKSGYIYGLTVIGRASLCMHKHNISAEFLFVLITNKIPYLMDILLSCFQKKFFQYRIEADGKNRWGGIWEVPRDYTFLSTCDKQTEVKLIKKFDSWDDNSNLAKRMPRLAQLTDLLLSTASTKDDFSGSLVYSSGVPSASYLKEEKPKPNVVRFWMREGAR